MFVSNGFRGLVCLAALSASSLFAADSFKITLYRPSQLGASTVSPGEYKVTVDGTKAEFKKGRETFTVDVKEEKSETKAARSYVRYTEGGMPKITEMVAAGRDCRWLIN